MHRGLSRKLRGVKAAQLAIRDFASHLTQMAIASLKQDGEHAAMFFLRFENGQVEPRLFESDQRRGRDLMLAIENSGATAVGVVAEAWAASASTVPDGGRVRDSADTRDILLVAALDRNGNQTVFETTVIRRRFRGPLFEQSREHGRGFRVAVFDEIRELWGLPQSRHYAGRFGSVDIEVPHGWSAEMIDGMVQILPDNDAGAMHITIRARETSAPIEAGEAQRITRNFAKQLTSVEVAVEERLASWV